MTEFGPRFRQSDLTIDAEHITLTLERLKEKAEASG